MITVNCPLCSGPIQRATAVTSLTSPPPIHRARKKTRAMANTTAATATWARAPRQSSCTAANRAKSETSATGTQLGMMRVLKSETIAKHRQKT